jgi:hypothetical protein
MPARRKELGAAPGARRPRIAVAPRIRRGGRASLGACVAGERSVAASAAPSPARARRKRRRDEERRRLGFAAVVGQSVAQ